MRETVENMIINITLILGGITFIMLFVFVIVYLYFKIYKYIDKIKGMTLYRAFKVLHKEGITCEEFKRGYEFIEAVKRKKTIVTENDFEEVR